MAYGLNMPKYGYQKPGGGTSSSYYKPAQAQRVTPVESPFAQAPGANLFQQGLLGSPTGSQQIAPRVASYTTPPATDQPAGPPAAAPKAGPAGGTDQPPAYGPPTLMYDYKTDPVLQQIQAVSVQSRQGADTQALSLGKQLAIRYGDSGLANNVLHDSLTGQAADQNPYSVFAQLKKNQQLDANQLDQQLNQQNLFYGGARIKQQGQLADRYQSQQAAETANMQDAFNAIQQNRLAAYLSADQQDQQAQQDAYNRALSAALTGGYSYGDPGNGGGGDTTSTPAPADGNTDPGWGAPIPEARGGGGIGSLIGPARSLFNDMSAPGTSYAPPSAAKAKASAGARAALNELSRVLGR